FLCKAVLRDNMNDQPQFRAVTASIGSPSRINWRARAGGFWRVRRNVPPAAGIAPSLISGRPKRALQVSSTVSQTRRASRHRSAFIGGAEIVIAATPAEM